jgi:HPt (histidine-containing phosphotransfer) domain-containing protein
MTIKECYEEMGGEYQGVISRLGKDDRVARFLPKLLADPSYEKLCKACEERNADEAFRAAHTMKGVCLNLSLTRLANSASLMTEKLRGREEFDESVLDILPQLKEDYEHTCECIRKFMEGQ